MAILKNTTVSGSLRATDTLAAQTVQFKILKIPNGSSSTNYTTGTNGYIIKTNGTNVYWDSANNHTHSYLANTNTGAADRPIYISGNAPAQTTYRMSGTNTTATAAIAITTNLPTGNWYVSGTTDIYAQNDGVVYAEQYDSSWIHEIYGDYRTGQIAVRGKNNGTWQAWRKVLDETNARTLLGVTDNSSNTDVTSSDTNLITARTLYYQLAKKGYTTNTGTVTSITLKAGTGISLDTDNTAITTSGTRTISNTGVTSIAGKTGAVTLADLGLSQALRFIGITSTSLSDGATTSTLAEKSSGSLIKTTGFVTGDVVIDTNSAYEYVWTGSAWERLGGDSSYKTTQTAFTDSTGTSESTTATRFVYSVSQDANGVVSFKTRPLPTYNNYSLPLAANGTRGGIQIGYTTSGKNYAVQLSGEKAYVNVPWTDTNTKVNYTLATTTKSYLMASSDAPTSTTTAREAKGDTGVYLTTTAGELSAVRHSYNNNGTEKLYTCYNSTDNSLDFIFV